MKAIAGISSKHMALLDEYRMALGLWSETRALYAAESVEIVQATRHLEDLERELVLCDQPTFATKAPPASGEAVASVPPTA
jgi:hypothetical protein